MRRTPLTLVLLPLLALLLVLAVLPARGHAATTPAPAPPPPPGMPPRGKVLLGLGGHATTPPEFSRLTRVQHDLYLITVPWNEARTWNMALDRQLADAAAGGYRLVVHIGAQDVNSGREVRSPGVVSRGGADRYFLDMARVLNDSNQFVYLRPPAEMNGHWSLWSAFNENGTRRDRNHSTAAYRRAFQRIALIARGGDVATIDARLARLGMPPLATTDTTLPSSGRIAMVFNPQARGKPDVRGNQPWDYYPGRRFVDYVANDLYAQSGSVAWDAHEALYRRYAKVHPFLVAEYAPWGYDDPAFVSRMFAWAGSHPRTVGLVYFNGTSGTTFRLADKSGSLHAYRVAARAARFRCAAFDAFWGGCAPQPVTPPATDT